MTRYILALFLWIHVGTALGDDVRLVDLRDPGRSTPYQVTSHLKFLSKRVERGIFRGLPVVVMDFTGDGYDNVVKANNHYISAISDRFNHEVTHYQTNLPPHFSRDLEPAFTVTKTGDLDGDGAPDLIAAGTTEDFWTWGFWVLDPATGAIKSHFQLEGFTEVREDGYWDGNYGVVGTIENPADGDAGPAVILTVNVGFDLEGRGVMAVDPWSGRVLWHFIMGPNPMPSNCILTDLDDDGDTEIAIIGRSPDNLGGRTINGFSDDVTRLFVLDHRGKLLWTRPLGEAFGNGTLLVHDLDDDGIPEIITTAQTTPRVWGEIVVWSAGGEALVRHEGDQQFSRSGLLPATDTLPHRLVVSTTNHKTLLFEVTPRSLDLVAQATLESSVLLSGVLDILPEPGPEIVLSSREGVVWILDGHLDPLAVQRAIPNSWGSRVVAVRPDSLSTYLSWAEGTRPSLTFAPAPRSLFRNPLVAGPSLLALASLVVFGTRKLARRPRLDPATLREVRLALLEDLELSSHGAMAPLRSLRRLLWNLGALESGLGDQEKVMERVRSTWQDCTDGALPHLRGILDRARVAGLAKDNIRYAERVLDRIDATFAGLAAADFAGPELATQLSRLTAETTKADDALQDLRREVAEFFRTSLKDQLSRALRANEEALEEARVTVKTGYLAVTPAGSGGRVEVGAEPQYCLIDPDELGFVLDNLIGNAIRAMDGARVRNLGITWSVIDGMLMTDVSDTGCGIDPEDHERILDTRYTSREGGGHGLPRSRKILRKYGGSLVVHTSEPGRGSTLRLSLPLA